MLTFNYREENDGYQMGCEWGHGLKKKKKGKNEMK